MKKIIVSAALLFVFYSSGFAQQKASEKVVISSANAVCEECKDFLEARLLHEEGITAVNVNYQRKTITVTYLTDRTSLGIVRQTIADWGFDADTLLADERAYNRVPACCKRPIPKPVPEKPKQDTAKKQPTPLAIPPKKG